MDKSGGQALFPVVYFWADFHRYTCGCSSVVEHLLAKEDVASSSLVTRSIVFPHYGYIYEKE